MYTYQSVERIINGNFNINVFKKKNLSKKLTLLFYKTDLSLKLYVIII